MTEVPPYALQAARAFDLVGDSVVAHERKGGNANEVYRATTAAGAPVFLRVSSPARRLAEVEAEGVWMDDLARAGLTVARPLRVVGAPR